MYRHENDQGRSTTAVEAPAPAPLAPGKTTAVEQGTWPAGTSTASAAPAKAGPATATAAPGRATELWPGGPITRSKGATLTLDAWLPLVRAFEAVYGSGADAVQRLRRLTYSAFSHIQRDKTTQMPTETLSPGSAGGKFDLLLNTGLDELTAPATTPPLPPHVLDGLFSVGAVTMPDGQEIDVSHLWCMLDLNVNGEGAAGTAISLLTGASVAGIVSWTGDLASWFLDWFDPNMLGGIGAGDGGEGGAGDGAGDGGGDGGEAGEGVGDGGEAGDGGAGDGAGEGWEPGAGDGKRGADRARGGDGVHTGTLAERIAELNKHRQKKTAIDDLLGDMDAQVLADQLGPTVAANGSLADGIAAYYQNKRADGAGADRRFHQFVAHATPAIPFVLVSASPMTVALASDAGGAIFDAIYSTYQALSIHPTPVTDQLDVMRYVADEFVRFLQIGLTTGQVKWPP